MLKKEHPHRKKLLENLPDRLYEEYEPNTSEWFGSILRYFWFLGKRKFNSIYTPEEFKKNKIVGRWFKVVLYLLLIYLCYLAYIWLY